MHERGRLAAAGRTDDQIPGQLVDPASAQAVPNLGALQRRQCGVEALAQHLQLLFACRLGRVRRSRRAGRKLLHQASIAQPRTHDGADPHEAPEPEQCPDGHVSAARRHQGLHAGNADQRADEPDQQRQRDRPEQGQKPA